MLIPRLGPTVAFVLLVGSAAPNPAYAEANVSFREGLLRAKPAVVLVIAEVESEVTLDCGSGPIMVKLPAFRETGTGWFIDSHGWVVTNGHVVQPAHETPRWLVNHQAQRAVTMACLPKALERTGITPGEDPTAEDAIKRKLLDHVLPTARVTLHPHVVVLASNGSRVEAEVKKYAPPVSAEPGSPSARDLALLKIPGDTYPVLRLADSKAIQIGDPLHIIGFPAVVLAHELLNESASREASVTNGAVSGFKQDKSNHPFIQTDAPASWGTSGAPAVDDRGAVVGVLTFVSVAPGPEGGVVQGFSFVIPSQAVRSFVQDTLVTTDSVGKFNPIWYAGLRAFFTEDWKGAVHQFEQADKPLPGLPDVKRMLDDARDMMERPPRRPFPWFWVAIAVTFVSAGGYGVQFYVRWQNNRHRILPRSLVSWRRASSQPSSICADPRPTRPCRSGSHPRCAWPRRSWRAASPDSSLLLSGGVNPIYVQRQLEHVSMRLTVDLYRKWLPMEHKATVARLDDPAEDAGAAGSARTKGDSGTSGPTGPWWAPLSRTTPR